MILELNALVTQLLTSILSSILVLLVLMFMLIVLLVLMMRLILKETAMLVPLELLQLIREHVKEVVRLLLTVRRSVETVCHALFVTLTSGSTHQQLLILVLLVH